MTKSNISFKKNIQIGVVLANRDSLFSQALSSLLGNFNDIQVVGTANTGKAAAQLLTSESANTALIDADLYGWPLQRTIRECQHHRPDAHLVVLAGRGDGELRHGLGEDELRQVVYKSDPVERVVAALRAGVEPLKRDQGPLTVREVEVLRLMAGARTNQQIASLLSISPATVKRHASNIYFKLDAVSRLDAVTQARQARWF